VCNPDNNTWDSIWARDQQAIKDAIEAAWVAEEKKFLAGKITNLDDALVVARRLNERIEKSVILVAKKRRKEYGNSGGDEGYLSGAEVV
jgi:NAD(P)H-hydrate repair Nnr-like enzyme with NAD(P)H-hydrate epimerase domain